jgi:hypothetical protein
LIILRTGDPASLCGKLTICSKIRCVRNKKNETGDERKERAEGRISKVRKNESKLKKAK